MTSERISEARLHVSGHISGVYRPIWIKFRGNVPGGPRSGGGMSPNPIKLGWGKHHRLRTRSVWAVEKWSDCLYSRQFILAMANKLIAAILVPDKATPPMVAARLQRWSSFLSSYDYSIEYVVVPRGKQMPIVVPYCLWNM